MNDSERRQFEMLRQDMVNKAVQYADRVILDACCGNPEVLALLTADVALRFAEKTQLMAQHNVNMKMMLCELNPKIFEDLFRNTNKPSGG